MLRLQKKLLTPSVRSFSTWKKNCIKLVTEKHGNKFDAVVIGGGIAGAAAILGLTTPKLAQPLSAAVLSGTGVMTLSNGTDAPKRVLLIEREGNFTYHSTGRSAAIYSEVYGSPSVRALSTATKAFYYNPVRTGLLPSDASEDALVTRRGALWAATSSSADELRRVYESTLPVVPTLEWLSKEETIKMMPWAKGPYMNHEAPDESLAEDFGEDDGNYAITCAMLEADAADMNVHEIFTAMTNLAMQNGAVMAVDTTLKKAHRQGSQWELDLLCDGEDYTVYTDLVVNAGGAWVDTIATALGVQPIGIEPRERTIIQFCPLDTDPVFMQGRDKSSYLIEQSKYPSVFDFQDRYYYKPDAGRVLASPCDERLVTPQDVQPTEIAVAVCMDRLERCTAFRPQVIEQSWAGLRSFFKDREFALGFDQAPGSKSNDLMWVAGLGGYGIQTAMGNARFIAGLAHGSGAPVDLADNGLSTEALSPMRFRK